MTLFHQMCNLEVIGVSAIVDSELADRFASDVFYSGNFLVELNFDEAIDLLRKEDKFIISVLNYPNGEQKYFLQELISPKSGKQYIIEDDVIFIQEELLDVYDKERTFGLILTLQ